MVPNFQVTAIQENARKMCTKFNNLQYFDMETLDNCSDTSRGLELIPYSEYLKLINNLTNNKASGKSGIQFEAFKYSPNFLLEFIYKYFYTSQSYNSKKPRLTTRIILIQ